MGRCLPAILLTFSASALLTAPAAAQTTSGVFSPSVKEGHRSFQYRGAFAPEDDGREEAWRHRLHYQQSINGDLRWRGIVQYRQSGDDNLDFDYVQGELLWELSSDQDRWKRALRFDLRIRDEDRPALFRTHFTNHIPLNDKTYVRVIGTAAVEQGDNADDGIGLELRGRLAHKLDNGATIGVDSFNGLGSTDDFDGFSDGNTRAGPFISTSLGNGWSLYGGVLLGLSDPARDTDFRLFVTKGL
ncbi:MAG: hypothetical protein AAGA69_03635 [Pseudomonadota bacterium]